MKPAPCGFSTRAASFKYERNTGGSACTSESKLKMKSTERLLTPASRIPSLTIRCTWGKAAKRRLQMSMHTGLRSTATSCLQRSFRNCVQRPAPGPISRIAPQSKNRSIIGNSCSRHCLSAQPQGPDHSSPPCAQSHLFQVRRFSSMVGGICWKTTLKKGNITMKNIEIPGCPALIAPDCPQKWRLLQKLVPPTAIDRKMTTSQRFFAKFKARSVVGSRPNGR